jgi:hypothetical protein
MKKMSHSRRFALIVALGLVVLCAALWVNRWIVHRSDAFLLRKEINAFFQEVASSGTPRNHDLRSAIPPEWEEICICWLGYMPKSHVEKNFAGRIRGSYQSGGSTYWSLLGITADNEITQVLLDDDASQFLVDNKFPAVRTRAGCVSREEAILTWKNRAGRQCIQFGTR